MNAIETRSLTKSYGGKTALDGLELTIPEGELFALLGVNGAGKSTAIKLLSGIIRPSSGSASILGHDISADTMAAKALLGTSPQETAVAPNLSVRENLELMAGIYGADGPKAKAQAQQIINKFHMESIADSRAKNLSGGWQRRLSIAMALICQPRVLFLDEPTLGLDVLARRELWQLVSQLKSNMAIILTTHYLEEAEALADRIGILSHGKLVAVGTAAELMNQTNTGKFEDAFVALAGGKQE